MHKQTSARVSSLAGKHQHVSAGYIGGLTPDALTEFAGDVRTLAASALGQDEHAGQESETFVDRLHREFNELQDRLQKLSAFLIRGAPGVKDDQRELLNMQLDAMRLYHAVLKLRLLDLPPPNKDQGKLALASEENIGEPVQTGGHDHVRDGDPDFNS